MTNANDQLPLTVTVCTLDEERNLPDCLASILKERPREVIVIDGGSEDATCAIAESFGVRVIDAGRKGLAHQRKTGVDAATEKYIALIDADHRPQPGSFRTLIEELENNNYTGIEAQIHSVQNTGYWDWAMEKNFELNHNFPGPRIMIGTPCIYRAEPLKRVNFDPFFSGPSDDTDLCYRMVKAGYKLGVGTPSVFQEHRSDFGASRKKWIWYGKGDAQFAWRHPERAFSIIKHELYNYPIKKSCNAICKKEFRVIPFFILFGLFRHIGFLKEMFQMIVLGKRIDRNIYKT